MNDDDKTPEDGEETEEDKGALRGVIGAAGKLVGGAVDAAGAVGGAAVDAGMAVGGAAVDAVEKVGGAAVGAGKVVGGAAVGAAGELIDATGNVVRKTKDGIVTVGGQVVDTTKEKLVNTSHFITSSEYRRTQGWPWLKLVISRNKDAVWKEMSQSDEMLRLLWRQARGQALTDEEKAKITSQMADLARVVPALGIFMLPGGMILLPLLARALPWNLLPSSFREKEAITDADIAAMAEAPPAA